MSEKYGRESVGRRKGKESPRRGGIGHTLRQREATAKTMTSSHTNHREPTVLPTTVLHRAKKMTKKSTLDVFVLGEYPWNPTLFTDQQFSLSLSLSVFHFPARHSPCLYFLTVNTVLYMHSARVRGQLS